MLTATSAAVVSLPPTATSATVPLTATRHLGHCRQPYRRPPPPPSPLSPEHRELPPDRPPPSVSRPQPRSRRKSYCVEATNKLRSSVSVASSPSAWTSDTPGDSRAHSQRSTPAAPPLTVASRVSRRLRRVGVADVGAGLLGADQPARPAVDPDDHGAALAPDRTGWSPPATRASHSPRTASAPRRSRRPPGRRGSSAIGTADCQLGVEAVDHGLLRHPPDPEADGLVGLVPGARRVGGVTGRELADELGIGEVEQLDRPLDSRPAGGQGQGRRCAAGTRPCADRPRRRV